MAATDRQLIRQFDDRLRGHGKELAALGIYLFAATFIQ